MLTWGRFTMGMPISTSGETSASTAGWPGEAMTGRQVPGRGKAYLIQGRAEHRAQHGRYRIGLEVPHFPVEPVQHVGGISCFQRICAQRDADTAHDHCRREPGAGHIADDGAHLARGEGE